MSAISWLGNAEYGVAGTRLRADNPFAFKPSDISGLQLWLDANDGSTIVDNNFGTILSWSNKGDLSGNFDLSGTADVRYGENFVNGLNVVTFNANAYMIGTFAFNFQARSLFVVSKRNTIIDSSGGIGIFTWLTGDTTGAIESGILYDLSNNSFDYLISKHPGFAVELDFQTPTDTTGYAELATFVNSSTDLSANYVSLNGTAQTPIVSNLASGYATSSLTYFLGNYFGGVPLANDYDLCEVLMYDSALDATQIEKVETYLRAKWAITGPPPPAPFSPQDITGLQIWFDSTQYVTTDLSGVVDSWKNMGIAGGFAAPDVGYVYPTIDASMNNLQVLAFNQSQLKWNTSLKYLDRTQFVVTRPTSDMVGATYPFLTFVAGPYSCMQSGLNWDSNTSNHQFALCQNGLNCPAVGQTSYTSFTPLLVVLASDSTNTSNNLVLYNNGSNINFGSNLGNLFDQSIQTYQINNAYNQIDGQNQNLGEILEYDSVLSASNIALVTTYLSDKWGLGL